VNKFTAVTVIHCWKSLIFGWRKAGKTWDLWQNFWRNLHFLMNEKWHFWRQNPLAPNNEVIESFQILTNLIYSSHIISRYWNPEPEPCDPATQKRHPEPNAKWISWLFAATRPFASHHLGFDQIASSATGSSNPEYPTYTLEPNRKWIR